MKKQDYSKEICHGLGIKYSQEFESRGSTTTKKVLEEIYLKLNPDYNLSLEKHDVAKAICTSLNIKSEDSWFVSGSTVTTDAWHAIHSELKNRNLI